MPHVKIPSIIVEHTTMLDGSLSKVEQHAELQITLISPTQWYVTTYVCTYVCSIHNMYVHTVYIVDDICKYVTKFNKSQLPHTQQQDTFFTIT